MYSADDLSTLKIPFTELQVAYTRHLLLKEVIIKDVSLYILSILFEYKKQIAYINYEQLLLVDNYDEHMKYCLDLLLKVEDRFINAAMLYRIGNCSDDNNMIKNAYDLLNKQVKLSPLELFYKGCILHYGKGADINIKEAKIYYKLSKIPYALLQLGGIYYNDKKFEKAFSCFENAAKLNDPHGKYYLAHMFENGKGCKVDLNHAIELYQSAAQQGHFDSIEKLKSFNVL
jgi:TPR repeat protein